MSVFHQQSALRNRQATEINRSYFFIIRTANMALTNKDDSGPLAEENHPFNHKCRRCESVLWTPYYTLDPITCSSFLSYDPDSALVSGHI